MSLWPCGLVRDAFAISFALLAVMRAAFAVDGRTQDGQLHRKPSRKNTTNACSANRDLRGGAQLAGDPQRWLATSNLPWVS
jgi:hypothetical protein